MLILLYQTDIPNISFNLLKLDYNFKNHVYQIRFWYL